MMNPHLMRPHDRAWYDRINSMSGSERERWYQRYISQERFHEAHAIERFNRAKRRAIWGTEDPFVDRSVP